MPRKSNKYVPHCEVCQRVMNDVHVLTDMWRPGTLSPLRICSAQGCRGKANELGYFSTYQESHDSDR
jgi:hypothetical protein